MPLSANNTDRKSWLYVDKKFRFPLSKHNLWCIFNAWWYYC